MGRSSPLTRGLVDLFGKVVEASEVQWDEHGLTNDSLRLVRRLIPVILAHDALSDEVTKGIRDELRELQARIATGDGVKDERSPRHEWIYEREIPEDGPRKRVRVAGSVPWIAGKGAAGE